MVEVVFLPAKFVELVVILILASPMPTAADASSKGTTNVPGPTREAKCLARDAECNVQEKQIDRLSLGGNKKRELKKGGSPQITKGQHPGDSIALNHVLPRAIVPELVATERYHSPLHL